MKRLALVFALALLVAACGDVDLSTSDTTPPGTTPAPTAAAAAVVEETVPGDDHADDSDSHGDDSMDHADDDHADDAGSVAEDGDVHTDDEQEVTGAADADRTVQVAMTDFAFDPGEFEAMAGETIEFVVSNLGVVEHEFRLSNEHRIEEHLAAGHADHDDEAAGGHHEGGDVVLLVEPGETGSITVTFGEDTTLYSEVACLIPGHYEAGMKAPMRLSA